MVWIVCWPLWTCEHVIRWQWGDYNNPIWNRATECIFQTSKRFSHHEQWRQLIREKRAQIVALRQAGFRQQWIADRLQCRQSSNCYAIRSFQETGSNLDHPRSGRPRVSTRADDAYLCQIARRRRNLTARQLQGEWVPAVGRRVSLQTVRNRLELPSANLTLIIFWTVNICIFIHMKHFIDTYKWIYTF